jgi:hypothetical protein
VNAYRDPTERVEAVVLAVILAVVAVAAGWASFTHVHDWSMRHAPAGTPDAFGWVNAVISELVPVAAFLTIKRRRRAGVSIRYPLFLLLAAASLSLAAQLAVAQRSVSGWLLSAVPALAFMALVKLVFTGTGRRQGMPADQDQADPAPAAAVEPVTPAPPAVRPRPAGLAPVPASAFTRVNGATAGVEVTR